MSREKPIRDPITPRDVLIPLGVGLVLGAVTFLTRGGLEAGDSETFWRAVCDAFSVPGLMMTCAGLLSLASEQGAFDGLSFTTRKAFGQILSEKRRNAMPKTYYDFVAARREKQRRRPRTTLYTGLVFLAMALASLAVYYSVI